MAVFSSPFCLCVCQLKDCTHARTHKLDRVNMISVGVCFDSKKRAKQATNHTHTHNRDRPDTHTNTLNKIALCAKFWRDVNGQHFSKIYSATTFVISSQVYAFPPHGLVQCLIRWYLATKTKTKKTGNWSKARTRPLDHQNRSEQDLDTIILETNEKTGGKNLTGINQLIQSK